MKNALKDLIFTGKMRIDAQIKKGLCAQSVMMSIVYIFKTNLENRVLLAINGCDYIIPIRTS